MPPNEVHVIVIHTLPINKPELKLTFQNQVKFICFVILNVSFLFFILCSVFVFTLLLPKHLRFILLMIHLRMTC